MRGTARLNVAFGADHIPPSGARWPFRAWAFFAAGFFPSIGKSISFCPAEALRGFLPFGASLAIDLFNASIKLTTLSALGRG